MQHADQANVTNAASRDLQRFHQPGQTIACDAHGRADGLGLGPFAQGYGGRGGFGIRLGGRGCFDGVSRLCGSCVRGVSGLCRGCFRRVSSLARNLPGPRCTIAGSDRLCGFGLGLDLGVLGRGFCLLLAAIGLLSVGRKAQNDAGKLGDGLHWTTFSGTNGVRLS